MVVHCKRILLFIGLKNWLIFLLAWISFLWPSHIIEVSLYCGWLVGLLTTLTENWQHLLTKQIFDLSVNSNRTIFKLMHRWQNINFDVLAPLLTHILNCSIFNYISRSSYRSRTLAPLGVIVAAIRTTIILLIKLENPINIEDVYGI